MYNPILHNNNSSKMIGARRKQQSLISMTPGSFTTGLVAGQNIEKATSDFHLAPQTNQSLVHIGNLSISTNENAHVINPTYLNPSQNHARLQNHIDNPVTSKLLRNEKLIQLNLGIASHHEMNPNLNLPNTSFSVHQNLINAGNSIISGNSNNNNIGANNRETQSATPNKYGIFTRRFNSATRNQTRNNEIPPDSIVHPPTAHANLATGVTGTHAIQGSHDLNNYGVDPKLSGRHINNMPTRKNPSAHVQLSGENKRVLAVGGSNLRSSLTPAYRGRSSHLTKSRQEFGNIRLNQNTSSQIGSIRERLFKLGPQSFNSNNNNANNNSYQNGNLSHINTSLNNNNHGLSNIMYSDSSVEKKQKMRLFQINVLKPSQGHIFTQTNNHSNDQLTNHQIINSIRKSYDYHKQQNLIDYHDSQNCSPNTYGGLNSGCKSNNFSSNQIASQDLILKGENRLENDILFQQINLIFEKSSAYSQKNKISLLKDLSLIENFKKSSAGLRFPKDQENIQSSQLRGKSIEASPMRQKSGYSISRISSDYKNQRKKLQSLSQKVIQLNNLYFKFIFIQKCFIHSLSLSLSFSTFCFTNSSSQNNSQSLLDKKNYSPVDSPDNEFRKQTNSWMINKKSSTSMDQVENCLPHDSIQIHQCLSPVHENFQENIGLTNNNNSNYHQHSQADLDAPGAIIAENVRNRNIEFIKNISKQETFLRENNSEGAPQETVENVNNSIDYQIWRKYVVSRKHIRQNNTNLDEELNQVQRLRTKNIQALYNYTNVKENLLDMEIQKKLQGMKSNSKSRNRDFPKQNQ